MAISKKMECHEDLKARILKMDLEPGAELDETQVSRAYGLSRTPLREVLQALAGEGFVRLQRNRGASVASMEVETLRALMRSAPLVLVNVARLAADDRSAAHLEVLTERQAALVASLETGDAAAAALADHGFHLGLGEAAGDPYLMPALRRILVDQTRLSQGFFGPSGKKEKKLVKKALATHDALVAAVMAQDAVAAAEAALARWALTRERLERLVTPAALPVDVTVSEGETA